MKDSTASSAPRAGDILIAHPDMPDNLFSRTLVFLHSFSKEGAMGFILNRPLGQSLEELTGESALPEPLLELPLYFGGPVHAGQCILAQFEPLPDSHGFRCDLNPDAEAIAAAGSDGHLRAFLGMSGWSAGQLEEELQRRDWEWIPADTAFLRESPGAALWELISSGDRRWQKLRDYLPPDPERN